MFSHLSKAGKIALFAMLLAAASPAFASPAVPSGNFMMRGEPELVVNYDAGTVRYRYQSKKIDCGQKAAAGCTHSKPYAQLRFSGTAGAGAQIILDIGFKPFLVDLTTENEFGSCRFDVVLKHELTHVALFRAVMERYIKVIGASMKQRFANEQKKGKTFAQIAAAVKDSFNASFENFKNDADAQNALLDKDGQSEYQYGQCKGRP